MKFAPKNTYEYVSLCSTPTSTHYVTENDILSFHGKVFFDQWKVFIDKKNIAKSKFGNIDGYYYYDYKEAAYSAQQFLESN